jgi:peptidyl-prolyl cis-trans isomerase A (cyclophilin A)
MNLRHAALSILLMLSTGDLFAQSGATNTTDKPAPDAAHVRIETSAGNIEVEVDGKHAPITAANFLKYVEANLYTNATFFRTVTMSNQPNNAVKIQVIQLEADQRLRRQFFPEILLERTSVTGLHHLDGTLSMARYGPDTARDSFSICIGDQPEMDFGGKRNTDGQGFAAFGHVTKGMDIIHKIHDSPEKDQQLTPPIRIYRIVRID